ncbi:hypothetical protein C1645_822982 [Glomus cerebriforme]|uniref:F-box domain-containing protein n=1 Tax=Glomus cerebriforme TaxID=658196 RepID=A0A397SX26_9GLOM|nr:hypothetical protein C1645_822982 [Glomus cerebriforme]
MDTNSGNIFTKIDVEIQEKQQTELPEIQQTKEGIYNSIMERCWKECLDFFKKNNQLPKGYLIPELTNEIKQYFHNDYKTLHSCILVNRLWCRLAIPLLWEDPFSMKCSKNYHFIEIYLHYLNDDDKTKLNEYKINGINKVFEQLNVLESIHILYCNFNSDVIQQIINITKLFKLKTLVMNEKLQIESLQLLQKSGDYLENIGFASMSVELKQHFKSIIKYCTKIQFCDFFEFDIQNINLAFGLIKSVGQNLNYLSIIDQMSYDDTSSIVLLNLGQILPNSKLEYLRIYYETEKS